MRKDLGVKTYIFPQPVLIVATYDANGNPNAMNAAWGGIADSDEIMVCLGKHKTTDNLEINKACTIAIGDRENVAECDYVGIESGSDVSDKISKVGWSTSKSKFVNAPVINELPVSIDCELIKIIDGCKYLFKIINVSVDEKVLSGDEVDLTKFHPIIFDTARYGYYDFGEKVGEAFSEGKKIK